MAKYSLGLEELKSFQSANSHRAEMERLELERRELAELRKYEKEQQEKNAYRTRIERDDRDRRERARLEEFDRNAQAVTGPLGNIGTRAVRGIINDDDIAREMRNEWLVADTAKNIVVGMALLVAATAAEASYNKAMLDSQTESNKQYQDEMTRMVRESINNESQTLAQLQEREAETRRRLESTQKSYYVEYQDTRAEAQRVMESAKRDYDKEMTALNREEKRSDSIYRKEVDAINHSFNVEGAKAEIKAAETTRDSYIQSSITARDAAIQAAQTQYNAEVKRISSEYSGADRDKELQKIAIRRDELVSNANIAHDTNVQRYSSEYNRQTESARRQIEAAQAQIDPIAQRHATEIQSIKDRSAEIETKYKTVINHQNDVIQTSQIKYSDAVKDAKRENTMAQSKLDQYQSQSGSFSKAHLKRGEKYALQNGSAEEIAILQRVNRDKEAATKAEKLGVAHVPLATKEDYKKAQQISISYTASLANSSIESGKYNVKAAHGALGTAAGVVMGSGATNYLKAIEKTHTHLGEDLARRFGSDAEIKTLDKVAADIKAKQEAKRNGATYTPLATEAERKQADQIVQKYAGAINSEDGIKQTLKQYKKATNELSSEKEMLQKLIGSKSAELKDIDAKIANIQKIVDQVAADKHALKTNKDATGAQLTQEQRKAIAEKLQKTGNVVDQAKLLADLKTKKNASAKELSKLNSKMANNKILTTRLKTHAALLEKNGKTIASVTKGKKSLATWSDVKNLGLLVAAEKSINARAANERSREKGEIKGGSKKSQNRQNKGTKMFFKGISTISREMDRRINKGNDIHNELRGTARSLSRAAEKYDLALGIAGYVPTIAIAALKMPMGAFIKSGNIIIKRIGPETRLGAALSKRLNGIAGITNNKFMRNVASGGRLAGGFVSKALKAPSAILKAPMAITRLPQTLAKKTLTQTMRFTRKAAGVVVGGSARLAGKTLKGGAKFVGKGVKYVGKNTIGRTKIYQKFANRIKLMKDRVSSFAKNVSDMFNPLRTLKKNVGKILAAIGGFLSGIISIIAALIVFMLSAAILLLLFVVIIAFLIAMIFSAFSAVVNWFSTLTADHNALIKNDPQFVINQAVNYRNSELEIFELFHRAADDKTLINVNESPIYYALYDNGFHWFGWTGEKELKSENTHAWNYFISERERLGGSGGSKSSFKSDVKNYDSIKLSYYSADQLAIDDNGNHIMETRGDIEQYTLKKNPVSSSYELSNAKDALAMVDTLYTTKQDTMQKIEVLSYLGVGDYQVADAQNDNTVINNLFWASHKFIYKSGNLDSDIWYHVTGSSRKPELGYKYDENGNPIPVTNTISCPNAKLVKFTYTDQSSVEKTYYHNSYTHWNSCNSNWSAYGKYKIDEDAFYTTSSTSNKRNGLTASELYYYNLGITGERVTYPSVKVDNKDKHMYLSKIKTVSVPLSSYHRDSSCDTLRFFSTTKNGQYYVFNQSNKYMGTITFSTVYNKRAYEAMTEIEIYDEDYYVNKNSWTGAMNLPYFELVWKNGNYQFDIVATQAITSRTATSDAQKYLTGNVNDLEAGFEKFSYKYPNVAVGIKSYWTISCYDHYSLSDPLEAEYEFYVCPGHIDLDVAMVVSLMDDEDRLFNDAMNVQGLEKDTVGNSILGIFTVDLEHDIIGFGTVTQKAYSPKDDWSDDGGNKEIAKAKMESEIQYMIPKKDGSDELKDISDLSIKIRHKWPVEKDANGNEKSDVKKFWALAGSQDGILLYGMAFKGQVYYAESFVSGEQKNLIVYLKDPDTGLIGPKSLTLSINAGNRPIASVTEIP